MLRLAATILLNLAIITLIGVLIYVGVLLYRAYMTDEQQLTQLLDPRFYNRFITISDEEWKVYISDTFTFEHPAVWKPKETMDINDSDELVDLKIPVIFYLTNISGKNYIGYSRKSIDQFRPPNLKSEKELIMLQRRGYKWVSSQNKMIIYTYAVPLNTEHVMYGQRRVFYITAEATTEDPKLEATLDRIAKSATVRRNE